MKRILKSILQFIIVLFLSVGMVGCNFDSTNSNPSGGGSASVGEIQITRFRVYFVVDGKQQYYMDVTNKQVFTPPEVPEKKNFTAEGWVDSNGKQVDFSTPFEKSTTFYAKYEVDHAAITNEISTKFMSSNVKIEVTAYNTTFLGLVKTDIITSYGSGIIFHDQHGNYYVLTNEHVTNKNREKIDFKVVDYKGNEYKAYMQSNSEQAMYDLSVLYFKKKSEVLNVIKLAKNNPYVSEDVVAIGQPHGQNNTITFGNVNDYRKIKLTNGFEPHFDVITHSAPIDSGSSGGALLNMNLELVGLNFSVGKTSSGTYLYSSSIPIEIINLYLHEYVLIKK